MESLSRHPHRRKHSTTTSAFSFKNPYDDVLLSNGGERKSLEADEYSEIFSGSSSIPVLDLSCLDERVGSGDCRSSKLDYSNIFGGLRNDDVAVPYEELFNGSAKKTKRRSPADVRLPLQESGSQHSSGKTRRSFGEASDQSVDGVKQQFNMSFNRTNQRNSDASNGKTHIAQLHAVPEFAYFVDGTPQLQKTEDDRHVTSLKREVSRTWSFSAEVEAPKGKGGLSCEKYNIPDKSRHVNEVNLKSHFLKVPPPASSPSNLSDNKDPRQSRASNFASKEDASEKIAGECSPPFFGEEFDENSVAAVSAAALKKAIDHAQESIRIAKMIMERKKEGYQDASKPRPKGRLKVLDKETEVDHEVYGSKESNAWKKIEELDPIFTGIDGKFTPSLSENETLINGANVEVERAWENVEAAKEHGEAFTRGSKLFSATCCQSETLYIDKKVELEKLGQNVEAADTHGEATDFPGLLANSECRTVNLKSVEAGNNNSLMLFMSKLASDLGGLDTRKETLERREVTVHHTKGPEVAELVERALNTSQRMQGLEKSVEEAEQCQATLDHAKGPENRMEKFLNSSQKTREQKKIVDETGENLRTRPEDEVTEEREKDMNDKGKHQKKFEECEEMLNVENFTVLRSEFGNFLNESCNMVGDETLGQEETQKKCENASEWKEDGDRHGKTYDEEENGMRQKEAHLWFESEEQLKEALEEEIYENEPDVFLDIGEVEKKVNEAHKPEIDEKKQNHAYDVEEPKLPGEPEQNKVEDRHMNTSEYESEIILMEANIWAEVQKSAGFWDAEETNNSLRGAGRSEENHNKCQLQEAAYEEDIDEAVDVDSSDARTIFNQAHANDTSTIFNESHEACNVDLKTKADEYLKAVKNYKENDTDPEVTGTFSATDEGKEDNQLPRMDSLHRSASEEIFVERKLQHVFDGLSSDGKTENVGVTDVNPEVKLPEDEEAFKSTIEIHDAAQEYAAKINRQNLPEVHAPAIRTAEFDLTDIRQLLEQTSESDEGSVSTSSLENIDSLSAHESEECAENAKDKTSNKEELKDELEMVSNERKCDEERSEGLYSQLHSGPKEMEKSMETGKAVERSLNVEKNMENFVGTSPMEERDSKEGVQNFERNDHQQRMEAIKRGREREKDKIAVERAIREARERAFTEARERAERTAVERAAAEVRQRVMAEAREKLEKASVVKQLDGKASTEAKLRAERAAVERATAEARERALEKAMSQKTSTQARTQADRYPTERVSTSSRNNVLRHSFSSSDLENGMNAESAQRRKARLERHQRIMERAAKALAEKNMRDLLAQKEQALRNRLAESLDADIKRWAIGKEGNLRALLSTLQYILGPDSGWQPIPLTEIITTVALKKAYRKATLYVHPDKLQQRGASIQQKYICEKVFDLLKAAWNRFNSDER